MVSSHDKGTASETSMSKDEPLLSNCPLETAEQSRNYARVPGYKKGQEKDKKRKEKWTAYIYIYIYIYIEIHTPAYVATRLLLRQDHSYAVTLKTKVFVDYNHARVWVSWIASTRGLLLRGYTGCTCDSACERTYAEKRFVCNSDEMNTCWSRRFGKKLEKVSVRRF